MGTTNFANAVRKALATANAPTKPKRLVRVTPENARRSSEYWDFKRDGMTVSSCQKFLACREQFRLEYVEGWQQSALKMPFEFGNLLHSTIARFLDRRIKPLPIEKQTALYEKQWNANHPQATPANKEMMEEAYCFMEALWPTYIEIYKDDPKHHWDYVEDKFTIEIPEVDTIFRGIIDGVCLESQQKRYVLENKGNSQINENDIEDVLPYSFQNMTYLVAYWKKHGTPPDGVWFNVIRRPGSKRHKNETLKDYVVRLRGLIAKEPDHYFYRWKVTITKARIERWYAETLVPMLQEVKLWVDGKIPHYMNPEALIGRYGRSDMFDVITKQNFSFVHRKPVSSRLDR